MLHRGLDACGQEFRLASGVQHPDLEGEEHYGKQGAQVGQDDADFASGGVAVEGVDVEGACNA